MGVDFSRFFLIAGPCVVESETHLRIVASRVKDACMKYGVQWVLKASFDKANRSSIKSFRGAEKGLEKLVWVGEDLGVPVTSDVHTPEQARQLGKFLDIVQVPAFLCRQTDLLREAAGTGKPVNVKKGQFISPGGIGAIAEKLAVFGANRVIITERGSQFGYGDVVVDFRRFLHGNPWWNVLDITHTVSDWRYSMPLLKAALAVGVNGVFCEVGSTLCDEKRSIPVDEIDKFVKVCAGIASSAHCSSPAGCPTSSERASLEAGGGVQNATAPAAR